MLLYCSQFNDNKEILSYYHVTLAPSSGWALLHIKSTLCLTLMCWKQKTFAIVRILDVYGGSIQDNN